MDRKNELLEMTKEELVDMIESYEERLQTMSGDLDTMVKQYNALFAETNRFRDENTMLLRKVVSYQEQEIVSLINSNKNKQGK